VNLFQKFVYGINGLLLLATLLSCGATYIDPESFWPASLVAMTLPIFLAVNVMFIIYWLIAKPKKILISVIAILSCLGTMQGLIQFNKSPKEIPSDGIEIYSYNSGGYGHGEGYTWYKRINAFEKWMLEKNADIYCFQENVLECFELKGHENDTYKAHRFSREHGTSIYSKHPILNRGKVDFGLITNSCVWIDVKIRKDTFRIYSAHLKSNRITPDDLTELNDINRDYKKNISDTKGVLSKYGKQSTTRSQQAKQLLAHINKSPHKVILCGDFNEPPQSNVYKQVSKVLKDSYIEKGFGVDGTFAGKLPFLRIDYVMVDPALEVLSHEVISETKSDHFPLRVFIK
jgi:endonuclease/exonuclease/phosphatase family metal-dependent hydrolase